MEPSGHRDRAENLSKNRLAVLGAAWSLSSEWQFYMLALIAFGQNRRLWWILLVMAVAGMAWRLTVPIPWQFSRAFLPNNLR